MIGTDAIRLFQLIPICST